MAAGFVALYVKSATDILGQVNESGFSSLVSGINGIAMAAATIALVLAVFNQFLQIGYMSPNQMLGLMIKLILISYIGLQWGNFSAVSSTVQEFMDKISISILDTIAGSTKGNPSLPAAIDTILSRISTASDKALTHAAWYTGAGLAVIIVICLTVLGAVSALIIIYSKIMVSLYIIIAPIFICCLIFERLSDYFYRWLQGAVSYMMYPVITAGIMAMIAGITDSFLNSISDDSISTIAMFIPFMTLAVIATIIIIFIPIIVAGLSGMIQHISPIHITTPIIQALKPRKKDNNDDNANQHGYRQPTPPAPSNRSATIPSGPFPGEPARMFAREERMRKMD